MFDTMTITKALGSLCAALLVFLLGKWVADAMYVPGSAKLPPAYVIDTGAETEVAEPVAQLGFEEAYAMANPDAGVRIWNQCRACHSLEEGRNGVGPSLHGVMGRETNAKEGFRYSGALPAGLVWNATEMAAFIENPRGYAPNTSMAYPGLRNVVDKANLIAYIATFTPGYTRPVAPAPAAEAPADQAAPAEAAPAAPVEEAPAAEAPAEAPAAEAPAEAAPEEEAPAEGAAPAADGIVAAYAQASAADGARIWRLCQACHIADAETNRVGPHLVGMLDREIGKVAGFRYSGRLPEGVWTLEKLDEFLANPRTFAPGTTMAFPGVRNLQDRANVIAYIESLN